MSARTAIRWTHSGLHGRIHHTPIYPHCLIKHSPVFLSVYSRPSYSTIHFSKPNPFTTSPNQIYPTAKASLARYSSTHSDQPLSESFPAPSKKTWIDSVSPTIKPYLLLTRLDKPAGTWLLYLPCTFAIGMASFYSAETIPIITTLSTLALFGVGSVVMRSAGCIINDLWDIDIDKKVERTKTRPLASGEIKPFQAIAYLGAHLTVGLGILTRLNMFSILVGASSLALVAMYPLMKRITYWPQAFLGLTFNWGALLGFTALITDHVPWDVAVPLYLSGVCWTLVYDTIYALQDRSDDIKAGVKSTAVMFGSYVKPILAMFAVGTVGLLALSGWMNGHSAWFYTVSVGGGILHLGWQILTLNVACRTDAAAKFKSNRNFGLIVLTGILLDLGWRKWELYRTSQHNEKPIQ
ncbi:hypothetical protein BDV3_002258 [Batrachochytrium dendrobatidis]